MSQIVGLLLVLVGIASAPQQTRAVLKGHLLGTDSREPVPNILVRLSRIPGPVSDSRANPVNFSTRTDIAGLFEFTDVPPGSYRLRAAEDTAAPPQEYGTTILGRLGMNTGTVVTLAPAETREDIVLFWKSPSTVSGRVLSTSGMALVGMQVAVFSPGWDEFGKRVFRFEASTRTDDRGYYRLFGLPPRHYYLSAGSPDVVINFPGLSTAVTSSGKHQTVYYPGQREISRAIPLEVSSSVELRGVDFTLPRLSTFRIKGHILDQLTGKSPERAELSLVPRDRPVLLGTESSIRPYRPDGNFEFFDVAPGRYWVSAIVPPENLGGGVATLRDTQRPPVALAPVEVTDSDLDNVGLMLTRGLLLHGALTSEDSSLTSVLGFSDPRPTIRMRRVGLDGVDESNFVVSTIDAMGEFVFPNLVPGDYRFSIANLPPNVYVKEGRFGAFNLLQDALRILTPSSDSIRVVLATGGQIDGSVVDGKLRPLPNMQVVLVPNLQRDEVSLFRTSTTVSSGIFAIPNVAPGIYKAFAFEAIEPYVFFDLQTLERFEDRGTLVEVKASSNTSVMIRGIDAALQAR